jgi:hypothetical protein
VFVGGEELGARGPGLALGGDVLAGVLRVGGVVGILVLVERLITCTWLEIWTGLLTSQITQFSRGWSAG